MGTIKPLRVSASPIPDQLWAGLRQLAPAAMAFALGRGWLTNDVAVLLGVAGGVIWPIVAGQIKTRRRALDLAHVATFAPNVIATVDKK